MNARLALVPLTAVLLGAGFTACGSGGATGAPGSTIPGTSPTTSTTSTSTTSTSSTSKGWVGGEPQWDSVDRESAGGSADESATAMPMAAEGYDDVMPVAPGPEVSMPEGGGQPGDPLRAGSVDDNADFAAFIDYLVRIEGLGIATREFDPTGRIVVTVTGTSGLPVAGAEVTVTANGTTIATLRTTADGTARFLPALYGAAAVESFDFTALGVTASAAQNGTVDLAVDALGGASTPVAIDIMFLLDATGSMGDEIDRLKATIDSVASRLADFDTQPDVHLAMTLYRDEGDTFVTSTFDFTSNIDDFRNALSKVTADGGGDYPEALEEGLADALGVAAWRDPATTVQLVFLVADAPPRLDRQVPTPYPDAVVDAVSRGIKIIPIASSESDDQAEAVFRQLAVATGGKFVFLTYGAGGAATGPSTDIESTDYEELALDDLVVRFVAEELAALTGQDVSVPPPPSTPPTNPEGQ